MATAVSFDNFESIAQKSKLPVVLIVCASRCAASKRLLCKVLPKMEDEFGDRIRFLEMLLEKGKSLCCKGVFCPIEATPSLVAIRGGVPILRSCPEDSMDGQEKSMRDLIGCLL